MLSLFELDRLIRMLSEYIDIIEYAVSKYAPWVDIYGGPNDIHDVKIIRYKLTTLYENRIGGNKLMTIFVVSVFVVFIAIRLCKMARDE